MQRRITSHVSKGIRLLKAGLQLVPSICLCVVSWDASVADEVQKCESVNEVYLESHELRTRVVVNDNSQVNIRRAFVQG